MSTQEAVGTQEAAGTRIEGTPARVPFESPPPRQSPPRSEADSGYVDWVLPLIVFSIAIAVYAGIGYGLVLLLGSLL
jgi:hypothetical protein